MKKPRQDDDGKWLCDVCGEQVTQPDCPVQVGGWYGGVDFEWNAGRVRAVQALCPEHLVFTDESQEEVSE